MDFRDHDLSGWFTALWVIAMILVPFLALAIYLVLRGRGVAGRRARTMRDGQAKTDVQIRDVAGGSSATEQIAAKDLLDSGALTAEEFEQITHKALA